MKKLSILLCTGLAIAITTGFVINPGSSAGQKKSCPSQYPIPENVSKILTQSCASCHNEGGSGGAMGVWKLSQFDTYPAAKQSKKAQAICKSITRGSMPPKAVQNANPEMVLTQEQKDIVCQWAASLKKK
jgi:hypothetical protein